MSKKSRRRNKKLLAILALAGGAAFLGRGKGAVSTAGQPVGVKRTMPTPLVDAISGGTDFKKTPIITPKIKPIIKKNQYVPVDKTLAEEKAGKFITDLSNPKNVAYGMQVTENMMRPPKIPFTPAFGAFKRPAIDRNLINKMKSASQIHMQAKGGRVGANKGGSVTGIAKRGFGRALKKK